MSRYESRTAMLRARQVPVAAWLRKAFAGLTPTMLAIVVGLLALRILGTNIDDVLLDAETARRYRNAAHAEVWLMRALRNLSFLLVMAAPILLTVVVTRNLGPQKGGPRVLALATAIVLSSAFGVLLRMYVGTWTFNWENFDTIGDWLPQLWVRYVTIAAVLTAVAEFLRWEAGNLLATRHAEMDAARLEREMTEARLQLLQAQVEPHFLFNTLANLRRLYRNDRAAGREMLDNLVRYFEVALPRVRDAESTLDRDAKLIDAYLRVHQIRMGERLTYDLDIPVTLREHRVPSMMLLTLVENAIKHGLNPVPEGGAVRIAARRIGDRLALTVSDTGAGFRRKSGSGTGLANIRTRLAALFGPEASLSIEANHPAGCVVTISLPFGAAPALP